MSNLDGAVVFSRKYHIALLKSLSKQMIENLGRSLIQDLGRPLSHNGIIVGHIKVLAKVADEEFLFLSLTRLDQVDCKVSSHWPEELVSEWNAIDLDINVLVFGYDSKTIEKVVENSLAVFRQQSIGEVLPTNTQLL